MTANYPWLPIFPFIFSISLKLFSSSFDSFLKKKMLQDMEYKNKLSDKQRETIADQAVDASQRVIYIVALFVTILSAVTIASAQDNLYVTVGSLFIILLIGAITILKIIEPLGWAQLKTKIEILNIEKRNSFWLNSILIFFDLLLLIITVITIIDTLVTT